MVTQALPEWTSLLTNTLEKRKAAVYDGFIRHTLQLTDRPARSAEAG
jgi:hypothetical protein